ncbi:MAG: GntR family transcriptional regulator [Clostridia bacterium]|nr:GntR family transcriptional regulator [Clostridia bacterium]
MISFDAFRAQNGLPIYLQILRYIKRGIVCGDITDGDALPSRRMLSAMLGVNPNTIQKAYRILEEDGLIASHAGAKSVIVLNEENRARIRRELLQDDIRETAFALRGMGLSLEEAISLLTQCWDMPSLSDEEDSE